MRPRRPDDQKEQNLPNHYFDFKEFTVQQESCAQKVSTDACLFGAWTASISHKPSRILDIGAGTGLLMLMLAQKTSAHIVGLEIDDQCFTQLEDNIAQSKWSQRLRAYHADARVWSTPEKFDLVISNPPYYEKQLESDDKRKNQAWHDESLELRALITIARAHLQEQGMFALIMPQDRALEVTMAASASGFQLWRTLSVRHSPEPPFTRKMFAFGLTPNTPLQERMEIRDDGGIYSDAFRELLKDYYLFV